MRIALRFAVVGFLALGLAACSDETTGPDDEGLGIHEGEIRFTYSGAKSGTFSAKGAFEVDEDGDPKLQSFAFATEVEGDEFESELESVAFLGINLHLPKLDVVAGALGDLRKGTFSPDSCAQEGVHPDCAALTFSIDIDVNDFLDEEAELSAYLLTSGTVEVTSIAGGRIRGSFTGTAKLLAPEDSGDIFVPNSDLTVSSGSFDLPLLKESDFDFSFDLKASQQSHSWWRPAGSLLSR